jgi:ParB family chromosome partitioning protein
MDGIQGAHGQTTSDRIILVDPFRCRLWSLHDRHEDSLTEAACRPEIDSISKYGQLVPVLGRRLHGDLHCEVELIYGARRWFAARHLNKPLRVQVCLLNDREALVAMDIENRHRKDISPYERGRSYARWLHQGHFTCQDEIARALQISASQVCRLLKLSRLPSVVVGAFAHQADILEGWGIELAEAWEDEERRSRLARRARVIGARRASLPARKIFQELMAACERTRPTRTSRRDQVIFGSTGKPLIRVRRLQRSLMLTLPASLADSTVHLITQAVADIMRSDDSESVCLTGTHDPGVASNDSGREL